MYSPSHQSSMSMPNVATPSGPKLRRLSSPVPPPAPLDLPEPTPHHPSPQPNISRSPLRNGVTLDRVTGALSEDGSSDTDASGPWGTREQDRDHMGHSPSPSITQLASSFAHRVGSLVTSASPSSQFNHMPTEAELEAEAEYQRERSRREAERILNRETRERKNVEERVLEMLESSRPFPTRAQTAPSSVPPPPSPTKENASWWSTAISKLTPSKDKDLTPAQQIIQDTKAREKERRKGKEKEWPSNGQSKYYDPAFQQQLALPPGARPPGGQVGGGANVPRSPGSPSPHSGHPPRQLTASPTTMTPSPSRSPGQPLLPPNPHHNNNSTPRVQHSFPRPPTASPVPSRASARDPPPLYAQFTSQGALDIPETLLTIARRFEKLERWAVGHTRALEERMSDVEKWLVDKEREREREAPSASSKLSSTTVKPPESSGQDTTAKQVVREVTIERKTVEVDQEVRREVVEMKEELGELRGRVGELGREMARLASSVSSPPSEASGFGIGRIASPPADTPAASPSPRTLPSVPLPHGHTQSPSTHSIAQSETASIISTGTGASARTKLPYPSGDYRSSPSPPSRSPPSSQNYSANNASSGISRMRPLSYSGLPIPQTSLPTTGSPGMPRGSDRRGSPALAAQSANRAISTSPSPRKRYTVALGQPLSSSSSPSASNVTKEPPTLGLDEKQSDFGQPLFVEPQTAELHTAFFTEVPTETEYQLERNDTDAEGSQNKDDENDYKEDALLRRQETIGKTPITLARLSLSPPQSQESSPSNKSSLQRGSPRVSPSTRRIRTQSAYGVPGSASIPSLSSLGRKDGSPNHGIESWRTRSRSIERVGLGIDAGRGVSNFVDPLIVRKKEKDGAAIRSPVISSPGGPQGRVRDLLAFFDAEKP